MHLRPSAPIYMGVGVCNMYVYVVFKHMFDWSKREIGMLVNAGLQYFETLIHLIKYYILFVLFFIVSPRGCV